MKERMLSSTVALTFGRILNKVFKYLTNTVEPFVNEILPSFISAYRKHYSTTHDLINLIEGWKNQMNKGKFVGAVPVDLSKAFDCVLSLA